jgi:hypothetical protein
MSSTTSGAGEGSYYEATRQVIPGIDNYQEFVLPTDTENENLPNFKNYAYYQMCPAWELVDDVYAGTFRIRSRGQKYIPQFPLESGESWNARIDVAVLMNVYARTVDAMTGLVIGSGLKTKNVPKDMEKHLKNIDNAGTQFEVFARDVMRDSFNGHCVILVDMPDVPADQKPRNKAEEKNSKLRPYWTRKKPDAIFNWRPATINGETVVSQITFREVVSKPLGEFGEQCEVQYIRWYLNRDEKTNEPRAAFKKYVEYEEQYVNEADGQHYTRIRYKVVASGETHLKRIPIAIVYGDQTDGRILESKPPLLDLAHKNIEHLQIDSDYKKGLSIAGIALPVIKTDKTDDELVAQRFAWDKFMVVGPDEDFKFEEANGNALPNKVTALSDIKREMGVLGLSLIAERADANITATERLLDSVQQSNQLMQIQASLILGLRVALEIHAEWMKLPTPKGEAEAIEVGLGLDWTELVRSADNMQTLFEMAKEDFLSTLTLIEAAGKYGVLPSYIKPEEEVAQLKKEGRVRQSRFMMKSTTSGGVTVSDSSKGKTTQLDSKDEKSGNTESVRPSMTETGGN